MTASTRSRRIVIPHQRLLSTSAAVYPYGRFRLFGYSAGPPEPRLFRRYTQSNVITWECCSGREGRIREVLSVRSLGKFWHRLKVPQSYCLVLWSLFDDVTSSNVMLILRYKHLTTMWYVRLIVRVPCCVCSWGFWFYRMSVPLQNIGSRQHFQPRSGSEKTMNGRSSWD